MARPKRVIRINDFSKFEHKLTDIKTKEGKLFSKYIFKGKFTRDGIKKFVQEVSDKKHKTGVRGKLTVNLRYPEGNMGGVVVSYGQPVRLYTYKNAVSDAVTGDIEDPAYYPEFVLTITDAI